MFVWYVIQLARSLRDTWYSWPDPCVIRDTADQILALYTYHGHTLRYTLRHTAQFWREEKLTFTEFRYMHRNQTSLHGGNLLAQNSLQEVRIGGFQLRFLHFVAHFGLFYVTLPTQTFGEKLALYSGRITVIQPVSRITVIRYTAGRYLRDTAVSRITYRPCITPNCITSDALVYIGLRYMWTLAKTRFDDIYSSNFDHTSPLFWRARDFSTHF